LWKKKIERNLERIKKEEVLRDTQQSLLSMNLAFSNFRIGTIIIEDLEIGSFRESLELTISRLDCRRRKLKEILKGLRRKKS